MKWRGTDFVHFTGNGRQYSKYILDRYGFVYVAGMNQDFY